MSITAMSGRCSRDGVHQCRRVAGRGADLDAGLGEQPRQALAQQRGVVGDHDAHGRTASTSVPPARARRTASDPRSAVTRSASPQGRIRARRRRRRRGRRPRIAQLRRSRPRLRSRPRRLRACLTTLAIASGDHEPGRAPRSGRGTARVDYSRSSRSGIRPARSIDRRQQAAHRRARPVAGRRPGRAAPGRCCRGRRPHGPGVAGQDGRGRREPGGLELERDRGSRCWAPSWRSRSIRLPLVEVGGREPGPRLGHRLDLPGQLGAQRHVVDLGAAAAATASTTSASLRYEVVLDPRHQLVVPAYVDVLRRPASPRVLRGDPAPPAAGYTTRAPPPSAAATSWSRSRAGSARPMRTVSTASKRVRFTRRPTARRPQTYDARATTTRPASPRWSPCELSSIGVLPLIGTSTHHEDSDDRRRTMAYAAAR